MSQATRPVTSDFQPPHGSLRGYILGFSASVILTLSAYFVVTYNGLQRNVGIGVIALLAVVQCTVQLICFLHLGNEFKPRWKLLMFGLMLTIVTIVVVGSLWIMSNLNSHGMYSPAEQQKYVHGQDGL